jgi:hypothetical protein
MLVLNGQHAIGADKLEARPTFGKKRNYSSSSARILGASRCYLPVVDNIESQ